MAVACPGEMRLPEDVVLVADAQLMADWDHVCSLNDAVIIETVRHQRCTSQKATAPYCPRGIRSLGVDCVSAAMLGFPS